MSEETEDHNDGTWTGLKKTIIGLLTTAVLGAGGVMTSKFIGGDEEAATPAQQQTPIIINNNNQQQQQSGGKETVIIREKTAESAPQKQTENKPKKEGDEFKETAPKW
jgi:hypothetical protein